MKKIEEIIEEKLNGMPFLADALHEGLINTSALARKWHTWFSKEAYKDVTESAISMALRRHMAKKQVMKIDKTSNFPVRTILLQPNLFEIVLKNSDQTHAIYRKLTVKQKQLHDKHAFFHFSEGIQETMIIANNALFEDAKKLTAQETLLKEIHGLSAVSVLFPDGTVEVPGIFYPFFRALAWENISVVESFSIWSELVFIIQKQDAEKAISILQQLTE